MKIIERGDMSKFDNERYIELLSYVQYEINENILTIIDIPMYINTLDVTDIQVEEITTLLINTFMKEYCIEMPSDMIIYYDEMVELYMTTPNEESKNELDLGQETHRETHLVH